MAEQTQSHTRSIPNHLKIVTVAQMQELERVANEGGHPYARMMEQAGKAVADGIVEAFPAAKETPVLVLVAFGCGLVWSALRAVTGSVAPALVAHLLWDVLILMWLPLG